MGQKLGHYLGDYLEEFLGKSLKNYPILLRSLHISPLISLILLVACNFMVSSSSFVAGMNKVMGGSSSVRLEDFPPLSKQSGPNSCRSSGSGGTQSPRVSDSDPRVSDSVLRASASSSSVPSSAPNPAAVPRSSSNSSAATSKAPKLSGSSFEVKNPPSWSFLFASAEAKLQFVAPIIKDSKKMVVISKSIFDQGTTLWDDCLLGQFFWFSS